ncbi:hypothetical protein [Paraburkholderia sediminicola]|uniref:hypothetical protein n=1 Tax=Paraburkholderia sediminicola TaxID=458836 RepID=UPI0038BAB2F9
MARNACALPPIRQTQGVSGVCHGGQKDRLVGQELTETRKPANLAFNKAVSNPVSKKTTSKTARSSTDERAAKLAIYRAIGL